MDACKRVDAHSEASFIVELNHVLVLIPVHVEMGKGLAPAEQRIRMCELAVADSPFIMVDPWEVSSALKIPSSLSIFLPSLP